jgi:hypothetical protein
MVDVKKALYAGLHYARAEQARWVGKPGMDNLNALAIISADVRLLEKALNEMGEPVFPKEDADERKAVEAKFKKKVCPLCERAHDDKGYNKVCRRCWEKA